MKVTKATSSPMVSSPSIARGPPTANSRYSANEPASPRTGKTVERSHASLMLVT